MPRQYRKSSRVACEVCASEFRAWAYALELGYERFCSRACKGKAQKSAATARFWDKVHKTEDCWLWTGAMFRFGYGMVSAERIPVTAHRFSWRLAYGEIPDGMCVLHRCDNPPCVRPDHLFLGTNHDNIEDMVRKGRAPKRALNLLGGPA